MKKSYFLICSVVALSLCACGGNNNQEKDPGPYATPTMEVAFEKVADNCMVPSYVKAYIDAMHEQENEIQYPHRVDPLNCNMTYEEAANYTSYGDGHTYDDDHSGGVDVCTMLRNGSSQPYKNVPIELKWSGDRTFSEEAKVYFWSESDKSDIRSVSLEEGGKSAKLPNLKRNTKYYYQLVDGDDASQMKNFVSGDYTRMISLGSLGNGVSNIRDMGGYQSSYGCMIRQGLIFRGGEVNQEPLTADGQTRGANYDQAEDSVDQKNEKEIMNIGLELDLRTKSGCGTKTESAFAYDGNWVWENTYPNKDLNENSKGRAQYVRCAINSYDKLLTDPNRSSESDNADRNLVKEIFEYFAKADEQHVYFHCWGGADRTGVTGFLLLGILGATYTDAIIDFELTTLTNNKRCHMHNSTNADFPKFLNKFVTSQTFTRDGQTYTYTYDGEKTLRYNSEQLLLAMGVEEETIEQIRTIMLPGYQTGVTQETEAVNKTWHS